MLWNNLMFSCFKNKMRLILDEIAKKFYQNKNSSSLGITRILFVYAFRILFFYFVIKRMKFVLGLMMLLDILYERGGRQMMSRWGHPKTCLFPLFFHLRTPGLFTIGIIYGVMWIGALGITLGYKFKVSTVLFAIPYWLILLLDKSYWNNHSYLFGVISILLIGSSANYSYSLDSIFKKSNKEPGVPFWNYFILRYQFFILYFMAGLKKFDGEWLNGYSMRNLSKHWVFDVFKFFLTIEQIDYLVVHCFGFLLDLTLGFWLLIDKTRPFGMFFGMAFHIMNSRLFSIGVFPYVCMVTMPIFCDYDWPEVLKKVLLGKSDGQKDKVGNIKEKPVQKIEINWKQRGVTILLIFHCLLQVFLPYSHFITKGFNNWTNGLYGYSWDMMVHSWNTALVVVQVKDNNSGKDFYISPDYLSTNERWSKHGDMSLQYAQCLKDDLQNLNDTSSERKFSTNISIYIDVWCSLNGRFQQRMFDPNYDLLKANWSPFKPVEWLLPLLFEKEEFRNTLKEIQVQVYSWSNYSDVLFIADFPGMHLENFLSTDLRNVTLTVLHGTVICEIDKLNKNRSIGIKVTEGSNLKIQTGTFHKIHTIGLKPSLYMYTYVNQTKEMLQ